MKTEIANRLRQEYEWLWDDSMSALPDGWTQPLVNMLEKLYALSTVGPNTWGPGLVTWVDLEIETSQIVAIARATPLIPLGKWNGERALACLEALYDFAGETGETCSVCGQPGSLRIQNLGSVVEGIFCDEHHATAAENVDRAKALYEECRVLFPKVHGSSINLEVPDYLSDLLATSLRAILKLVIDEDIVGKVLITRVEMEGDALFVRVRYENLTAVHLGVQMSINELVADLEVLSDETTRRHQQGGPDATS